MKTILWTGEHRIIPGYSVATRGQLITIPDSMANSYIEQGMATIPKKTPSKNPKGDK